MKMGIFALVVEEALYTTPRAFLGRFYSVSVKYRAFLLGLLLYSCVHFTYTAFGSIAPQHDEASNAWKRLAHIPILFTIMWREPMGTNCRKNGSKHCIGNAIG